MIVRIPYFICSLIALTFLVAVVVIISVFVQIHFKGLAGIYLVDYDVIWCSDEISCLHEVGHFVDHEGGRVSETPEFKNAVNSYIETLDMETCLVDCWMIDFSGVSDNPHGDWGGYSEMYANLYAYYRRTGWLPTPEFRVFFDYTTIVDEQE